MSLSATDLMRNVLAGFFATAGVSAGFALTATLALAHGLDAVAQYLGLLGAAYILFGAPFAAARLVAVANLALNSSTISKIAAFAWLIGVIGYLIGITFQTEHWMGNACLLVISLAISESIHLRAMLLGTSWQNELVHRLLFPTTFILLNIYIGSSYQLPLLHLTSVLTALLAFELVTLGATRKLAVSKTIPGAANCSLRRDFVNRLTFQLSAQGFNWGVISLLGFTGSSAEAYLLRIVMQFRGVGLLLHRALKPSAARTIANCKDAPEYSSQNARRRLVAMTRLALVPAGTLILAGMVLSSEIGWVSTLLFETANASWTAFTGRSGCGDCSDFVQAILFGGILAAFEAFFGYSGLALNILDRGNALCRISLISISLLLPTGIIVFSGGGLSWIVAALAAYTITVNLLLSHSIRHTAVRNIWAIF